MSLPRTVVHFVGGNEKSVHVAEHIYVNGQEVSVKEDGVDLTYGPAQSTVVTLDLQASEVSFTSTAPSGLTDWKHVAEVRGEQIADLTERNVELQDEVRYAREDAEARQDDAEKTEVERLTRERDEWHEKALSQDGAITRLNRDVERLTRSRNHWKAVFRDSRTDADGRALVSVRKDALSAVMEGNRATTEQREHLWSALDEREAGDE